MGFTDAERGMTAEGQRSPYQRAFDQSVAKEAERVRNLGVWEQVRDSPTYFAGMTLMFVVAAKGVRWVRDRWRGR